mmetsp:Transcript_20540/g.36937  ORF Transcript_20540/g.36937 Transcript_20540/m.36937 type:complete len:443 (+) Transcript_20540:53-1381(+)|eukprot:CAMPEP_0197663226 /NCGR_PEP_ID=MMETSP1338-20131121/56611_1 /TAXON_ID=43686 ORGANISM="Pelagodinium beii, Strain RCC1491" /NCGR_SAMPLE_ID=MMETSP1338 /ASSEMBLY_ACC=CAM_ASM_000754 /LENGTH=442 /DNA_ID=CAMNT_0043241489 /DNA_START=53 /DNA_END=1381 /DNA_ORIENTATION=-
MKSALAIVLGFAPLAAAIEVEAEGPSGSHARLPQVPPVFNAGPDGFPALPEAVNLLGDFKNVAQSVGTLGNSLEDQLKRAELEGQRRIENEKAIFEKKLKEQEQINRKLQEENSEIAKEIMGVHKSNEAQLKKLQRMEKVNSFRRSELRALEKEFDRAHKVSEDALIKGDDAEAPELQFLRPKPKKAQELVQKEATDSSNVTANFTTKVVSLINSNRTEAVAAEAGADDSNTTDTGSSEASSDDSSDEESKDETKDESKDSEASSEQSSNVTNTTEADKEAPSFLAISSHKVKAKDEPELPDLDAQKMDEVGAEVDKEMAASTPAQAEDLMDSLEKSLKKMRDQASKSEQKLKALFQSSYKAGIQRHEALHAQNKALTQSLASMKSYQSKLEAAEKRLGNTQTSLSTHLANLGSFLGKLKQVAESSPDAVKTSLEAAKSWTE